MHEEDGLPLGQSYTGCYTETRTQVPIMFKNVKRLMLVMMLLAGTHAAHAGIFGWQATVKALDLSVTPPQPHSHTVSANSYLNCEQARLFVINNTFAGYAITDPGVCSPLFLDPSALRIPELYERPRWPWPGPGPVCLTCPYLVDGLLEVIYPPEQIEHVRKLMDKYEIDAYNKALQQLGEQFDLQGFEEEMYNLENAGLLEAAKY